MALQQSRRQIDDETTPSRQTVAIDAEDVHVIYDDGTEAVQGVSLAVEEGEFFGFLGPNGAGKTTTIKTLVTLLSPTQGTVRINGFDTKNDPQAVRESIGYMAQETSIDLELTPRENLRIACRRYGVPSEQRAERIEELLALVDLRDVADKRAETFSGGMQKRLDTATVLVHRPPVVFLDEPTTGLDPEARLQVWNYFEEINDRGTTVFLTTQYLEEANELCDRLAILQDGQITHAGTPDALKSAVGTDTVTLALKEPTDEKRRRAMNAVRRIPALEVAAIETTADGLTIEADNARAATSELFTELTAADITVADFDIQSPTLDDVFLTLAGEGDTGENGPANEATNVQEVAR
ncbi:ATP-binding cassette domain-containing protein [Natrinema sp. 1APR25-10V2]|uniref:ABC transporter ATP-binding protein n=1 Tax=Natrinema sp. 1APR25-10V2 TaxID=2951081 RepID=UPI002874AE96|nr:ATP-binding cassette domain-containing protein [Natrinema sp. 1APR25-10V2]MDS0477197.1 ATP-binding cassette domain-containing protein [Natrinema sp. 1APR25-10V2]